MGLITTLIIVFGFEVRNTEGDEGGIGGGSSPFIGNEV